MIGNAFTRGDSVYVHDDRGRALFVKTGTLHGFTASSVTIRSNDNLMTFDERGMLRATVRAG